MIAHPSLPAKTLQEVFELARKTPGGLSFATPGLGTPMHLTGEILKRAGNAEFVHIPYKGGVADRRNGAGDDRRNGAGREG